MITVDRLSKSYDKIRAVQDFSFAVNDGEIYALIGPDGAGKTSIMRMICNLVRPDSGSVMLDNKNAFENFNDVKKILGYMPQSFSLYTDLTVEENLRFYSGIYGTIGQSYRDKREYLYSFSNLKPFADRRAGALSGGMKQKLALSCALIHNPKLLILDEPTTGVDPVSRRQFWEILAELQRQGVAILVSTPYMDEVARCDRGSFIFQGRNLGEGTPQQLAGQFKGKIYYLDTKPEPALIDKINLIDGMSARRIGAGIHIHIHEGDEIEKYHNALHSIGVDTTKLNRTASQLEDAFIQLMQKAQ